MNIKKYKLKDKEYCRNFGKIKSSYNFKSLGRSKH